MASCCFGENQERLLHATSLAQLILLNGNSRATQLTASLAQLLAQLDLDLIRNKLCCEVTLATGPRLD